MFCVTAAVAVALPLAAHCTGLAWSAQPISVAMLGRMVPDFCTSTVRLVERTQYYDFFGTRSSDADQDLRARLLSVNDHAGRLQRFAGQTDWSIEWQTCLKRLPEECRIAGVELTVNVAYTLPRWADRDWSTRDVRQRWDRYALTLADHERGHGQIALQVASLIEKELVGRSAGSCAALDFETSNRVSVLMRQGEAMQNDYDRSTEHGVLQGASFPFP